MHRPHPFLLAAALLATAPLAVHAQRPAAPRQPSPAVVRAAVETITEADFRQRLAVIADDSMQGRETPSAGLEKTAAYIAEAFRGFGLRPGAGDGTFFQRYPIRRSQVDSGAYLEAVVAGATTRWAYGRDFALIEGTLPDSIVGAPVVLMVGLAADTARPFGDVDVRGAVIVQVLPLAAMQQQGRILVTVMKGAAAGARAFVFAFGVPPQYFAAMTRGALRPQYSVPGLGGLLPAPLFLARDTTFVDIYRAAGEDLAAVRDTAAHRVRAVPGATLTLRAPQRVLEETSAPNVIGVLEGSDPRLRDEYVLVTAHMDHTGVASGGRCSARGADSVCNGADDDGSGTIGVVELARALAQLRPAPHRSIVFMTVSGEERGLWGSEWWAAHPTRPLAQAAADLQMDMISRNSRDSLGVVGWAHSTLGQVTERVSREHPEYGMALVPDPWHGQFYRQSDHYSFAQKGVPSVFFFSGVHPELHTPADDLAHVDADKAARALRMIFYVALEVANAAERPQWDPAARQEIVERPEH